MSAEDNIADRASSSGAIEIDLAELEPADRFPFWHDYGSKIYRPIELKGPGSQPLIARARILQLGTVVLARMSCSEQYFERTELMIKQDHIDDLCLLSPENGSIRLRSNKENIIANPGDVMLVDASLACKTTWESGTLLFATFPRHLITSESRRNNICTGVIKSSDATGLVLKQHLRTLWNLQMSGADKTCRELGAGLAGHVIQYFSAPDMPFAMEEQTGSRRLLEQSTRAWINENLHRQDLNAEALSKIFHASRSSLYELFREYGGIQSYIKEMRLQKAMDILQSAAGSETISLGKLALRLGFSSQSVFSRSFRDRWGSRPRDILHKAIECTGKDRPRNATVQTGKDSGEIEESLKQKLRTYYTIIPSWNRALQRNT